MLVEKLVDVFSAKTNLNLVLEFLDSDLEVVIKDRSHVFLPADIKSWMAMTLRGLEFCHRNWILHRVQLDPPPELQDDATELFCSIGLEAKQLADCFGWPAQNCRFRSCQGLCRPQSWIQNDMAGHYPVRPNCTTCGRAQGLITISTAGIGLQNYSSAADIIALR